MNVNSNRCLPDTALTAKSPSTKAHHW